MALTKLLERFIPFHVIIELFCRNPVPLTWRVNALAPGAAKLGLRLVMLELPVLPLTAK